MDDKIVKIKTREQETNSKSITIIKKENNQEKFEGVNKELLMKLSHTLTLLARYDKGE